MTDTPDLREQITALFRDGYLYKESPKAIADAVLGVVEPILADAREHHEDWWKISHATVQQLLEERDAAEASRRDWATEADEAEQVLERAQHMAEKLLHRYDTLTLALAEKWGSKKQRQFIDEVDKTNPWRPGRGIVVDEDTHIISLKGEAYPFCICPPDDKSAEQAAALQAAGPLWSLPQCSVHPDSNGGAQ